MNLLAASLISYLLGSVNFAYVLAKLFNLPIEKVGDANFGATNLYYSAKARYGKKALALFLIAALLDILKAAIPTLLFGPLAGAFAVVGHCFSIFSYWKTRKLPTGVGMASTIGWALATSPILIILAVVVGIPLLLYYRDVFKWERGHSYYPFVQTFAAWLYTLFFSVTQQVLFGLFVIIISTTIARYMRFKQVIKQCCKCK